MYLLFAASLLWASLISAATRAKGHNGATLKPRTLGIASWYGKQHQGRKMANGQRFDRHKFTAASWVLPLGTTIRVVNLENGKSVVVTVTDRGPNQRLHRILDLSEAAANQLGYIEQGLTPVFFSTVTPLDPEKSTLSSELLEPSYAPGQEPSERVEMASSVR